MTARNKCSTQNRDFVRFFFTESLNIYAAKRTKKKKTKHLNSKICQTIYFTNVDVSVVGWILMSKLKILWQLWSFTLLMLVVWWVRWDLRKRSRSNEGKIDFSQVKWLFSLNHMFQNQIELHCTLGREKYCINYTLPMVKNWRASQVIFFFIFLSYKSTNSDKCQSKRLSHCRSFRIRIDRIHLHFFEYQYLLLSNSSRFDMAYKNGHIHSNRRTCFWSRKLCELMGSWWICELSRIKTKLGGYDGKRGEFLWNRRWQKIVMNNLQWQ